MAKRTSKKETPADPTDHVTPPPSIQQVEVPLDTLVHAVLELRKDWGPGYNQDVVIAEAYELVSRCAQKLACPGPEEKATEGRPLEENSSTLSFAAALKIITGQESGSRTREPYKSFLEFYLSDLIPPFPREDNLAKTKEDALPKATPSDSTGTTVEDTNARTGNTSENSKKAKKKKKPKPFSLGINNLVKSFEKIRLSLSDVEILKRQFNIYKQFASSQLRPQLNSDVNRIIAQCDQNLGNQLKARLRRRAIEPELLN